MKQIYLTLSVLSLGLALSSCKQESESNQASKDESVTAKQHSSVNKGAIIAHYADLVSLTYQDSLKTAQEMQVALEAFLKNPTEASMTKAKQAWLVARGPYGQSEAFRFYAGPIDDDHGPEGLLNAWPLDENYIESESEQFKGIIQDTTKYPTFSKVLLSSLNEQEGEENISTGYHAIEFLLWGADTSTDSAGTRSVEDYTTSAFASRRANYLRVVTNQLVDDLQYLVDAWAPNAENYRTVFMNMPEDKALLNILNGIGMLSGFELARERVDVPLNTMSQEDEHSCFSDNTHNDIIYNALSAQNAFEGQYKGVYFNLKGGPSVKDLFPTEAKLSEKINNSVELAKGLKAPFDQLIVKGNPEGRASVKTLVDALSAQAQALSKESEAVGYKINIEE